MEFSIDMFSLINPSDNITIFENNFMLQGLVRCVGAHFTCAVNNDNEWLFIDDMSLNIKKFKHLHDLFQYILF